MQFIEELTAWLGSEEAAREARKAMLARTGVVSLNTLTSMVNGRYNASPKLRTNIRAQMTLLDQESLVSPETPQASTG